MLNDWFIQNVNIIKTAPLQVSDLQHIRSGWYDTGLHVRKTRLGKPLKIPHADLFRSQHCRQTRKEQRDLSCNTPDLRSLRLKIRRFQTGCQFLGARFDTRILEKPPQRLCFFSERRGFPQRTRAPDVSAAGSMPSE